MLLPPPPRCRVLRLLRLLLLLLLEVLLWLMGTGLQPSERRRE